MFFLPPRSNEFFSSSSQFFVSGNGHTRGSRAGSRGCTLGHHGCCWDGRCSSSLGSLWCRCRCRCCGCGGGKPGWGVPLCRTRASIVVVHLAVLRLHLCPAPSGRHLRGLFPRGGLRLCIEVICTPLPVLGLTPVTHTIKKTGASDGAKDASIRVVSSQRGGDKKE